MATRLNKYIAHHTGLSRREADDIISAGRVQINGAPTELGKPVEDGDVVAIDGKVVQAVSEYTYVLFHKPIGYVCSRRKQGDADTIFSLIPRQYAALKPVGRLDKDSSGLLILTDDGDFAHQMTHPRFQKTKQYEVTLDHALEPLHQQMINDFGVQLPDGVSKLGLEKQQDARHFVVRMSEGRNRQIRRTFTALGYEVVGLHRTHFGTYSLGNLKQGAFEIISK